MLFGREGAGPTEVRQRRPFAHWGEKRRQSNDSQLETGIGVVHLLKMKEKPLVFI